MCAKDNGYEACRNLAIRYQPPSGIGRMKELSELTQLQNKRCKNAAETALIVLGIDRRTMLFREMDGTEPDDDLLTSVLWMAMDQGAKATFLENWMSHQPVTISYVRQYWDTQVSLVRQAREDEEAACLRRWT